MGIFIEHVKEECRMVVVIIINYHQIEGTPILIPERPVARKKKKVTEGILTQDWVMSCGPAYGDF